MGFNLKIWGPRSLFGLSFALAAFLADQLHKWVMLVFIDIRQGDIITLTPFLDIVLVWNKGISYGLFQQNTDLGRFLLLGVALITVMILVIWLASNHSKLVALALGFLIGGAIGNALDRIIHGAVADFFSLHAFGLYWYVFNLADITIVAGVGLLLYDSIMRRDKT